MKKWKQVLCVGGVMVAASAGSAFASASLPDTGCDISSLLSTGITAMGAVAAVAVGGYIAFKVVKKGLSWAGRALG